MTKFEIKTDLILPRSALPMTERNWRDIGQIVKRHIGEGIDAQIQVTGDAYPKLRASTIASKREKGSVSPEKRLIDSGNLRRNQKVDAFERGVDVTIGTTRADVGVYMNDGTPPHTIVAKKAKALRFVTENGVRFATSVEHPGTPPVAFFGISEACADDIVSYIDAEIEKWLERIK